VRVAALYGIHGNLPALEAALVDVERAGVDTILVGGDVASGPMPAETLGLLRSLGDRVRFIRGNADRVLDFAGRDSGSRDLWVASRRWVAAQLGDAGLRFLAGLKLDEIIDVDGLGEVLFCHGSPGSDEETITRLTPDERLRTLLEGVEQRVVVCGHTHMQFDRRTGEKRVVNAGSVGVPYEAESGAYWLLAGPEISLRRGEYDVDAAVSRIRATGYPNAEYFAHELLSCEPSRPERMAALIERGPG
jgi:diadenosine tetraphosphatase ApaH/serine/threonine PP2A family protein phosphatase